MTITLADCAVEIVHALGGDPEARTTTDLANESGSEFMQLARWNWAQSVPATLGITADEEFTLLPEGFVGFVSTPRIGSVPLEMVSLDRLERYRTYGTAGGDPTACAVTFDEDALPRLELYPTPATTDADALRFFYSRSWVTLADDEDIAIIPVFCEPLFREVLRAVARGFEDDLEHPHRKQELLELLTRGRTFRDALATDRSLQQRWGTLRGGVGEVGHYGHTSITIG